MNIYFLRHASAGQNKSNARQDEKRPLDADGVTQSRDVGSALAALQLDIEVIASSPLKRATQTAALVANELGYESKVVITNALRPEADFDAFRDFLDEHAKSDAIMVVGHNPNLSAFASLLITDGASDSAIDLRKGAVARVERSRHSAELVWCLTPKVVRAIYDAVATSSRPKTSRK